MELNASQVKRLLNDVKRYIEELSLISRHNVWLMDIRNVDRPFYGKPLSPLLRAFQKYWNRAKRMSIATCVDLLEQFEVNPSQSTLQELRQHNGGIEDQDASFSLDGQAIEDEWTVIEEEDHDDDE